jgi:hypothetical protein
MFWAKNWHVPCNEKEPEALQPERMNAMAYVPKYSGLCETCEHDSTCMLRRSTRLEIYECEEFSNQPVTDKAAAVHAISISADPKAAAMMGLCVNCLNVVSCGFPAARHGVLQCEEYLLDAAGAIPAIQTDESSMSAA